MEKKTKTKPATTKSDKTKKPASKSTKSTKSAGKTLDSVRSKLIVHEKRRHPRFLLSGEQFREVRTGKIYSVYDLSLTGLSIKIDEADSVSKELSKEGAIIKGVLNLHPDSVEVAARVLTHHGDRISLSIELASTYTRSVLMRALSAKRLGASLKLVPQKLPLADFWFHGACNTDLLLRMDAANNSEVQSFEIYFSNFYCSWKKAEDRFVTGRCQSIGREKRAEILTNDDPVLIEDIQIDPDTKLDAEKVRWAKEILQSSNIDIPLKDLLLKKFQTV